VVKLSRDTQRKYQIIAAIASSNTPSIQDVATITQIPVSSIKRLLGQIRNDFDMDIRFVPDAEETKGRTGYYHIIDWGLLDRNEFLLRHGERHD
jgi:hypothetical protein